ncbi:MAG: hypothetical protein PHR06_09540 [Candidatus Cloacimonetes bacterium]|nr:hypothetical protein [Candidatus Cloacimonadota bacterium]
MITIQELIDEVDEITLKREKHLTDLKERNWDLYLTGIPDEERTQKQSLMIEEETNRINSNTESSISSIKRDVERLISDANENYYCKLSGINELKKFAKLIDTDIHTANTLLSDVASLKAADDLLKEDTDLSNLILRRKLTLGQITRTFLPSVITKLQVDNPIKEELKPLLEKIEELLSLISRC